MAVLPIGASTWKRVLQCVGEEPEPEGEIEEGFPGWRLRSPGCRRGSDLRRTCRRIGRSACPRTPSACVSALDTILTGFLSSALFCSAEKRPREREYNLDQQPRDDPLSEFGARLDRLKGEHASRAPVDRAVPTSGYGMAFTIAADLVGGVAGGAGLGWLVDRWLGTAPAGLIALFFVGALAGMWNVYRTVRGYDMGMGFRRPDGAGAVNRDETMAASFARPQEEGGDQRGQSSPPVRSEADPVDLRRRG